MLDWLIQSTLMAIKKPSLAFLLHQLTSFWRNGYTILLNFMVPSPNKFCNEISYTSPPSIKYSMSMFNVFVNSILYTAYSQKRNYLTFVELHNPSLLDQVINRKKTWTTHLQHTDRTGFCQNHGIMSHQTKYFIFLELTI